MSHRSTIELLFAEIWSSGKTELIDEVYCDDFVAHYFHPPRWGAGKAGVQAIVTSVRTAFPDYRETVLDFLESGDRVAVRIHVTGTNRGLIGSFAPTGKSVDFEEIIIFRMEDGRVREQWGVPDMLAFYSQLGILDVPAPW